jgi:hypothetical protein
MTGAIINLQALLVKSNHHRKALPVGYHGAQVLRPASRYSARLKAVRRDCRLWVKIARPLVGAMEPTHEWHARPVTRQSDGFHWHQTHRENRPPTRTLVHLYGSAMDLNRPLDDR